MRMNLSCFNIYYFNSIIFNYIYSIKNKNNNNVKLYKMQVSQVSQLDEHERESPSWLLADAEVAETINGSRNPGFQQLPLPFYERDVVDALHQLTQLVNSPRSNYEQIQNDLNAFDEKYKSIFRDDGRGLVFPQYIENKEVRLELEELNEAIIESRFRLRSSGQLPATQARSQLFKSDIINKYNTYKHRYQLEGGNRQKKYQTTKRYSQRRLRLRLRSKRRKNKNKTNKNKKSRRMF